MADNPTPTFKFGDRVEIGGRTMLKPGFSLVGLTGVIFPSAPNVPDGCLTVAVDWKGHGYTEENGYEDGSLPLFVNVPAAHLTDADTPEELKPKPKWESKSELSNHLQLGKAPAPRAEAEKTEAEKTETKKTEAPKMVAPKPDDEEGERPKLRLV